MTSAETLAAIDAEHVLLEGSAERMAKLDLLFVAQITDELVPGAIGIVVSESDQNLDGTLTAVGILTADETVLDYNEGGLPDGWEDATFSPLNHLSDHNALSWTPYLVGKRSRRDGTDGFLDVQRILAELTVPHAPVIVVVRDPDADNDITLHGFDAQVYDVDLGCNDLSDADELEMWVTALEHDVAQLPEKHPARVQIEETIASTVAYYRKGC